MLNLIPSLALFFLAPLALAECDLVGGSVDGPIETDSALCLSQGAGAYTFAMSTSLTGLIQTGTTGGQEVSGVSFQIMNEKCKILGGWSKPACGIPYTIKANFLEEVLTITSITMAADSSAYFSFKYANGQYSIRNNGCVCNKMDSAVNAAAKGCRCAFPVGGEPEKRAIAFEA